MRVLLDTHVILWALTTSGSIGAEARAVLGDPATFRVVSVASLWEIAIKRSIGRLSAPEDLPEFLAATRHEILPVTAAHAWAVSGLPSVHGDPFDRLLVAQAIAENIPLITHDRQLERYDVRIIRA